MAGIIARTPPRLAARERLRREAAGHPFCVPPGMAYAARDANRSLVVRLAREAEIRAQGYRDGFNNQSREGSFDV
jgi:hypothetical protein